MTYDVTTHQRDRIRQLERDNAGLRLLLEHAIWMFAKTIADLDARAQVASMSQDEFMAELAASFEEQKQEVAA